MKNSESNKKNNKAKMSESDFEKKILELEVLAKDMEGQKISLSECLNRFETGVTLYKECLSFLDKAEKKVMELTKELKEKKID